MSKRTQWTIGFRRWKSLLWPGSVRAIPDSGMSTVEYAVGTIAAAAFAALLYTIVTGDSVMAALTSLIEQALSGSM